MKFIKKTLNPLLMFLVMICFSQCSSTKKLQNSAPFEIGEVYYQHWVAGVKGGGSGINAFIPIISNPNNIILDSIYFMGKQAKLEYRNNSVFIGRFPTAINQKKDIIMSSEPYAEYGNKAPELSKNTSFKLKPNECIISYKQERKAKYFKISNILKKQPQIYQSAPQKQQ